MGHSVREYLERQSTEILKNICIIYSAEPMRSEYEESLRILEDVLKSRQE